MCACAHLPYIFSLFMGTIVQNIHLLMYIEIMTHADTLEECSQMCTFVAKLVTSNTLSESILTHQLILKSMRGRWASAAIGAGMARRSAGRQMEQETQAHEAQMQQAQQQIDAQQRQLEALQKQQSPQPQQEDLTQKLKKYGDLKQQGLITEQEFQKLKADLLSKM